MSFPEPRNGLVIRYSFLWSAEAQAGRDEGAKDRPCAIILVTRAGPEGELRVTVVPITHSPPRDPEASIPLPEAEARRLGLDDGAHWVRLDELNVFSWPGYDLRKIPGLGRYDYGMLSEPVYRAVIGRILALRQARRGVPPVTRD